MIFAACSGCREPVLARDRVCPHCGAPREPARRGGAALVMIASGALTGCLPIAEPAYGIADSGTSDWSESGDMSTTDDAPPFTTTTSPGTTHGTSPTPDPTNYTTGDDGSSEGDTSSGASSDDTSGDTGSSDDTSGDTSGDDDSSSGSSDGDSGSTSSGT